MFAERVGKSEDVLGAKFPFTCIEHFGVLESILRYEQSGSGEVNPVLKA